jgi:hypothetical protein
MRAVDRDGCRALRHCKRSEAIQNPTAATAWIASSQGLLAMTGVGSESVSRETQAMELALLSDTEFLENGPKDVLDVHPAEQPAQGISGGAQLFGGEFLALFYKVETPAQAV